MKRICVYLILILCSVTSCKKDWLDKKRNIALIVPTTLSDMRLLLNNNMVVNQGCIGIAEFSSDNYYFVDANYQALLDFQKAATTWQQQIFTNVTQVNEWNIAYQQVLYANVILEGLLKIDRNTGNQVEYDDIKGGALFLRARAFYYLAQNFSKPYDEQTAGADPGIPLRLISDVNAPTTRSTNQQTYQQIEGDLTNALGLVKPTQVLKTDASKQAVNGMLARYYLSIGKYDKAFSCADNCLKVYSTLLDYNTIKPAATYSFVQFNDDVIFHEVMNMNYGAFSTTGSVDTLLYQSYDNNDLRRSLYYKARTDGTMRYWGSYVGNTIPFTGIATDEILLTRAECYARRGNADAAMADLNTLLMKRFKTGTFQPLTATNADEALAIVLSERRKELVYRGVRWIDLRRLNKDARFAITLSRKENGQIYTLPPNDPRYTLPIPDYIINQTGIAQNAR